MDPHASVPNFPDAPQWSLLVGKFGQGAILAGLGLFLASFICALFSDKRPKLVSLGTWCFGLGATSILAAFGSLATLFLKGQYHFSYVWSHSDKSTAPYYKIAGVWSGQEGSFLLWACTSAIFGLLALRSTGIYRRWYTAIFSLFLGSLCGILAYETPFGISEGARVAGRLFLPPDGSGLTPSLQNYWVVIHPPTIFLGFGSLAVFFCWSVSAILTRNLTAWASMVRPWALLSLAILALGICMGGLWAYETLNWGGFWAWDPVENASFVPWLFLAAFVHGLIVQISRRKWLWTNLLFGALPFLWFVYGTFLTRSGFLSDASVHSFAKMNGSALWILIVFGLTAIIGFFALWFTRGRSLAKAEDPPLVEDQSDRQTAYTGGALLLSLLGTAIAFGMSVPLVMGMLGRPTKVVTEGLYHQVVVWFFIPIMILAAIGPFLSWRKTDSATFWSRFGNVLSLSLGLTGFAAIVFKIPVWGTSALGSSKIDFPFKLHVPAFYWILVLLFICLMTLTANVWRWAETAKNGRSSWGAFVSHAGLAILMAGLIVSRGFEQKERTFISRTSPGTALGYQINVVGPRGDLQDRNSEMLFSMNKGGKEEFVASPGLYFVQRPDKEDPEAVMWPHIQHSLGHDVYFALFEPIVYAWQKPLSVKQGETVTQDGISVTYDKPTVEGKPGQAGTKFGGVFTVKTADGTYTSNPKLVLGQGGLSHEFSDAGPDLFLSMDRVDPATGAVTVEVLFQNPIYPVDLYYKPLTILVWIGAGILTLGGLMAAYARRRSTVAARSRASEDVTVPAQNEDALVPAT